MRRIVLLDRDGTLNVDHGYVSRIQDFEWLPAAPAAVKLLVDAGYAIGVVTNQSGIARGLYSAEDVDLLHRYMQEQLAAQQAPVDATTYCPHAAADNCDCRKPNVGMAKRIEHQLGQSIDYPSSWMIGDKLSDVEFGTRLGMRTALIRSRYWDTAHLVLEPDLTVDSLHEAAVQLLASQLR